MNKKRVVGIIIIQIIIQVVMCLQVYGFSKEVLIKLIVEGEGGRLEGNVDIALNMYTNDKEDNVGRKIFTKEYGVMEVKNGVVELTVEMLEEYIKSEIYFYSIVINKEFEMFVEGGLVRGGQFPGSLENSVLVDLQSHLQPPIHVQ